MNNLNQACEQDDLLIAAHLSSDSLPKLLKDCIALGHTPEEQDIILMSALTAASSVMPNYYFRYGHSGKKYYPNLQTFIMAGAASGKGMASVGLNLVREINKVQSLLIPGDSTYPAFFTQLLAQNGIGYMHESEGSVITDIWKSGAMSYNTALRKAAEHEPITRNRMKDGVLEIECPRLSMLLTGTFGQFRALVPSVENGFFSRLTMMVVRGKSAFDKGSLSPHLDSKRPFRAFLRPQGEGELPIGQRMLQIYKALSARESELEFRLTEAQAEELGTWFEREYGVLIEQLGENFHPTVVRMAITTMRIAAILGGLSPALPEREGEPMLCSDCNFRTALLITSKLLLHAADAYNQIEGQKQQAVPERKGTYQKQMLLQSLPEEFETSQGVSEAAKLGIANRTVRRWMENWVEEGKLLKPAHGHYRKTA